MTGFDTFLVQNTTPLSIDNCGVIADAAQVVLATCYVEPDGMTKFQASGRNFQPGNWNTFLKVEDC